MMAPIGLFLTTRGPYLAVLTLLVVDGTQATVLSPMLTVKSAQLHLHGLYSVSTSVSHGGGAGGGGDGGGEQTPWQTA